MRRPGNAVLALCLLAGAPAPQEAAAPEHGVEYRGGSWFDGSKFVPRTMYVADGVFRTTAPARLDSVVDLEGGYVVPPFADAHQHLVDTNVAPTIQAFLRDGIFYVKDQGSAPIVRRVIEPSLNRPTSIDYVGANQGWTSPGGHPVEVIERGVALGLVQADYLRDHLDPGLVMQVESAADIEQRWSGFLADKPDFVKVYLMHSEEHARIRGDAKFKGNRGIDPVLVPEIVSRARAAGLQVSAHVYTAADFRNAVEAGVQLIAHVPGGRGPDSTFVLTDEDAGLAAELGVTVVTTVMQHRDDALTARLLKTQYARNFDVLRKHGVPLLVGSDLFPGTAATEIAALAGSGLFDDLELLRMWCVTTPRAIFPARRIGALEDGYEASFLVLREDPLVDIRATRTISLRVKQGVPIQLDR
jgi:amidohydrolase family protein